MAHLSWTKNFLCFDCFCH